MLCVKMSEDTEKKEITHLWSENGVSERENDDDLVIVIEIDALCQK